MLCLVNSFYVMFDVLHFVASFFLFTRNIFNSVLIYDINSVVASLEFFWWAKCLILGK